MNAPPELKMHLKLDVPSYRPNILKELDCVREECAKAVANALNDGRKDKVKVWCARVANVLIRKYSEREPTSGSENAPFRNITGLLYEAVRDFERPSNGFGLSDLKRACDTVLRDFRKAVQITAKKSSDL